MNFQKVYMNQVYSSSMMGQVAQMWRNQLMCDAVIKTGNVNTKAHRLILIAACPMLQHMENAAVGSHLEVRMSGDIKQSSVTTFLQYLYEGFMMLTEDNCRDVEKIGKLLHVDGVVKCCTNFNKCVRKNKGLHGNHFNFDENMESDHVHTIDLHKVLQDNTCKRSADGNGSVSPRHKRHRLSVSSASLSGQPESSDNDTDDRIRMTQSYSLTKNSFEHMKGQTPEKKSINSTNDVIEVFEDSIEVLSTEPREKDLEGWPRESNLPPLQRRMTVAVSSKAAEDVSIQIVNASNLSSPQTSVETKNTTSRTSSSQDSFSHSFSSMGNTSLSRKDIPPANPESLSSPALHRGQNWYDLSLSGQNLASNKSNNMSSKPERISGTQEAPVSSYSRDQLKSSASTRPLVSSSPVMQSRVPHHPVSFAAGSSSQISRSYSQTPTDSIANSSLSIDTAAQKDRLQNTSASSHVAPSQSAQCNTQNGQQNFDASARTRNEKWGGEQIQDLPTVIKIEEPPDTGGLEMSVDVHGRDKEKDEHQEEDPKVDFFSEGTEEGATQHSSSFADGGALQESLPVEIDMGIASPLGSYQLQHEHILCKICFTSFPNKESRTQHFVEVNNHGYPVACLECGKGFKTQKGYELHQKIQHTALDGALQCETCGKKFVSKTFLKEHLISHSDVRAYICRKCSKTFKHRHHLLRHSRKCDSDALYLSPDSIWAKETSYQVMPSNT